MPTGRAGAEIDARGAQLHTSMGVCAAHTQAADFGPKTAMKIVDTIRDKVKSGTVKTAADTRQALKVRASSKIVMCERHNKEC